MVVPPEKSDQLKIVLPFSALFACATSYSELQFELVRYVSPPFGAEL